jgi:hypothetical protein
MIEIYDERKKAWIDTARNRAAAQGRRVKPQRFWRALVRGGSSFLTFAGLGTSPAEQEAGGGDISFKMSVVVPATAARLGDAGSQEASSWG